MLVDQESFYITTETVNRISCISRTVC